MILFQVGVLVDAEAIDAVLLRQFKVNLHTRRHAFPFYPEKNRFFFRFNRKTYEI